MRYNDICIMASCLLLPLFGVSADQDIPTAASVHQSIENMWQKRQFDELDAYMGSLLNSYSNYVPALVAKAMHSWNCDVKPPEAISRLECIRDTFGKDVVAASPIFMELLDSLIIRYKDGARAYIKYGVSQQRLTDFFAPRKMDPAKVSKHWGEEMLFFNTPEVFNTPDGIKLARERPERLTDSVLERADMPQLMAILTNDKNDMAFRKIASQEIVRRRAAKGGVAELVNSLRLSDMSYTSQDTADALVAIGRDAVPLIVDFINDPQRFSPDVRIAIWVLVRIGVKDASVMQALQSVSTNQMMFDAQQYAKEAIQYFEKIDNRSDD